MPTVVDELIVALGVKADIKALQDWDKKTDQTAKSTKEKFQDMAKRSAKSFALLGGAAVAAGGAVFALVQKTATLGDQAAKDARKLGVTAEAIQELDFAAQLSGTSVETMKVGIQALGRGLNDAITKGTGPAAEAFEQLGISLDDAAIQSGDLEEVLPLVADRLATLPDGMNKTALAMKLFSRSGAELIPLLNEGSSGLAKMRQEARDTGSVISNEAAARMEEFNDDMLRFKKELQAAGVEMAEEFLPLMHDMIPTLRDAAKGLGEAASGVLELTEKIGGKTTGLVAGLGAVAIALGGLPALFAGVAAAGVLAGNRIAASFASAEDQLDALNAKRDAARRDTERIEKGRGAVRELTDRQIEGTLDDLSDSEYERLVEDAIRVGASEDLISNLDVNRSGDLARRRQAAADAAVFDPTAGLLTERERREVARTGRLGKKPGGGGGGVDPSLRRGIAQAESAGLADELREIGERVGATAKAIDSAIQSVGQQFAAGASQQVARQSGFSTLSGLTGVDVGKRQTDPLLAELFGDDRLPEAPISALDQGMEPQVLVATINNNFEIAITNDIDGAGDPVLVGDTVVDKFRELFQDEVQSASKLSKVNFAR